VLKVAEMMLPLRASSGLAARISDKDSRRRKGGALVPALALLLSAAISTVGLCDDLRIRLKGEVSVDEERVSRRLLGSSCRWKGIAVSLCLCL
jgi:hypothetical protein